MWYDTILDTASNIYKAKTQADIETERAKAQAASLAQNNNSGISSSTLKNGIIIGSIIAGVIAVGVVIKKFFF